jgi:hypothetical protein
MVEEDGAEGFVAAVQGPRGMREEVVTGGVVHGDVPDVSFFLAGIWLVGEFMMEPVSSSRVGPGEW